MQHSLSHDDVKDTWFDEFKIITPINATTRFKETNSKRTVPILMLSGRYLVRPTVNPKTVSKASLDDNLILLNTSKQKALTDYLSKNPIIKELRKKNFQTKEKGDLFNRYYVYFEFEIILNQ